MADRSASGSGSGSGSGDSRKPGKTWSGDDEGNEVGDESESDSSEEGGFGSRSKDSKSEQRTPSVRRKLCSLTFGRRSGKSTTTAAAATNGERDREHKKRKCPWHWRFHNRFRPRGSSSPADIPDSSVGCNVCVCTRYRRTEEHHLGAGVVFESPTTANCSRRQQQLFNNRRFRHHHNHHHSHHQPQHNHQQSHAQMATTFSSFNLLRSRPRSPTELAIDLSKFSPENFPIDDSDEVARAERAREIEEGVEPPPGYNPYTTAASPSVITDEVISQLTMALQRRLAIPPSGYPHMGLGMALTMSPPMSPCPDSSATLSSETHLIGQFGRVTSEGTYVQRTVHTQVDYIHCLVPDLLAITGCAFYWGIMDRYEAERLLDQRPEGTFLLRDSAQEEYLFSVSFRRYGRSLHARVEQWNHKFSFDSHDPGVYASKTVCGLIEHYKDPSCCMFFEPMLTLPLHRTFPFPLQHLCRAAICNATTYDGINQLGLPKTLKQYLKEYHYKQRVRVRKFELEH